MVYNKHNKYIYIYNNIYTNVNFVEMFKIYTIICTPTHKTNAHHPLAPFLTVNVCCTSYDCKTRLYDDQGR